MNNYYLTFGQEYRHEEHPFSPNVHPDLYIRIIARDWVSAHCYVRHLFGVKYSELYSESEFDPSYYPGGELICLQVPVPKQPLELTVEKLKPGHYAVRPQGALGTCGWIDGVAWSVQFIDAPNAAAALRKAYKTQRRPS